MLTFFNSVLALVFIVQGRRIIFLVRKDLRITAKEDMTGENYSNDFMQLLDSYISVHALYLTPRRYFHIAVSGFNIRAGFIRQGGNAEWRFE